MAGGGVPPRDFLDPLRIRFDPSKSIVNDVQPISTKDIDFITILIIFNNFRYQKPLFTDFLKSCTYLAKQAECIYCSLVDKRMIHFLAISDLSRGKEVCNEKAESLELISEQTNRMA